MDAHWWGAALLRRDAPEATWAEAGGSVSLGRLRREVDWLASTFGEHGIRAGETVAVHGAASFTQLWSVLALWSIGAQVILLPRMDSTQLSQALLACAPRFHLEFDPARRGRRDRFTDECEVMVRRLPGGRTARTSHCLIQFSSGTTDRAKPIGRTPGSLLAELERFRTLAGMPRAGERVAVLEPYTHSFGLIGGVLHALRAGATVVFPTGDSPAAIGAAAARADVLLGGPRHFAGLAGADAGLRLPRLRLAVSGGEALPGEVSAGFARRYGVRIGQAYGTTETGIISADLTGPRDGRLVGRPLAGVRTRVAGGVLYVHTEHSPYPRGNPTPGGEWVSTGDLVTLDPRTGAIRLRGRAGEPRLADLDLLEVERVLRGHRQVIDAVVLGCDPIEAHVAAAADLDQAELRSWCLRFLDRATTPGRYHVVPHLPRTTNGKVLRDRARLRQHGENRRTLATA